MSAVDWSALEADLTAIDERIPPMGAPYRTQRACMASLGQMYCVKVHCTGLDPVHVAAHTNYGVVAVWSEDGGIPQVNSKLARRVGAEWCAYLFGNTEINLADPVEDSWR